MLSFETPACNTIQPDTPRHIILVRRSIDEHSQEVLGLWSRIDLAALRSLVRVTSPQPLALYNADDHRTTTVISYIVGPSDHWPWTYSISISGLLCGLRALRTWILIINKLWTARLELLILSRRIYCALKLREGPDLFVQPNERFI